MSAEPGDTLLGTVGRVTVSIPAGGPAEACCRAEAYRSTTLAEAEAEAQAPRVRANAAAHAERSTAGGQADANRALGDSLREGNQELIAASRLIEQLPELVNAASRGIAGSNLMVLNGAPA